MSIENTATEHSTVSVRAMIHRQSVGQIIDVRQQWTIRLVVASDQHVHLIGIARSQIVGQVLSGEIGSRFGRQFITIAHLVEQNVLGDVLNELHGIASITNGADHQRVGNLVDFLLI